MMKRAVSLVLTLVLILTVLPVSARAEDLTYGKFPIYIGYADVDYMADQVLATIPLEGKDDRGRIQAVYDWIILNCERYEWDGVTHFDEAEVQAAAPAYAEKITNLIDNGQAVIRPHLAEEFGDETTESYYDSNYNIASRAYSMFMTRTGTCTDFASLLTVLLGHLGYDSRLIAGDFINSPTDIVIHKWNYVLVNGQYYWLDVRIDHATYTRTGRVAHDFFMWTDTADWAEDHAWAPNYTDNLCANAAKVVELYNELCHTHVIQWTEAKEPTCAEDGWEAHYRCTICGQGFADAEGKTKQNYTIYTWGHEWGAWEVLKECTHDEHGIRQRVCQRDSSHTETVIDKAQGNPFQDVPAAEYYETPVVWAVDQKVTTGMTATTFEPGGECTRAQVVTFLYRAAGSPSVSGVTNPFTDVPADTWYTDAVLWAVSQGITTGMTDTTFMPDGKCTRAQVVTFLHRAKGKPETAQSASNFTDVAADSWYGKAVSWAVEQGITTGMSATSFAPDGICTRGQVVTFLYRARDEEPPMEETPEETEPEETIPEETEPEESIPEESVPEESVPEESIPEESQPEETA